MAIFFDLNVTIYSFLLIIHLEETSMNLKNCLEIIMPTPKLSGNDLSHNVNSIPTIIDYLMLFGSHFLCYGVNHCWMKMTIFLGSILLEV